MRSLSVFLFVAAIGAAAAYCAQKKTVARGDALAAELMDTNKLIQKMDCDDKVPIGIDGAKFGCKVTFKNGDVVDYKFKIDREANIIATDHGDTQSKAHTKSSDDPWGE